MFAAGALFLAATAAFPALFARLVVAAARFLALPVLRFPGVLRLLLRLRQLLPFRLPLGLRLSLSLVSAALLLGLAAPLRLVEARQRILTHEVYIFYRDRLLALHLFHEAVNLHPLVVERDDFKGAARRDSNRVRRHTLVGGIGDEPLEYVGLEEVIVGVFGLEHDVLAREFLLRLGVGGRLEVEAALQLGALSGQFLRVHRKVLHPGQRRAHRHEMSHPRRSAAWIKSLLRNKLTIRAIQDITGIHWETIRNIQKNYMEEVLADRQSKLLRDGYHPHILAVDEFAIHKGHSYATCVMDLESGEVIWVGSGRAMEDFEYFFRETDPETLSCVEAVAMDMNASYHHLVEKYLPKAAIVYDRYHMQAQYGKDVLGVVRLAEARKHKEAAKQLQNANEEEKGARLRRKQQIKAEQENDAKLKKLRWTLLRNGDHLSEKGQAYLDNILRDHAALAVCYAMKEEMIRLFELRDSVEAENGWNEWFEAAKASGIDPLVRFAALKGKRLPGLIAHATFSISTGKLEGFNNKIKVAKRIGYGYRNEEYFFTLVRFLPLPSVKAGSYNFP